MGALITKIPLRNNKNKSQNLVNSATAQLENSC
jgi:hypothetical protein